MNLNALQHILDVPKVIKHCMLYQGKSHLYHFCRLGHDFAMGIFHNI